MNELEKLLTYSANPCINNYYLNIAIGCGQRDCCDCIWESRSKQNTKLLELIPILEIEPDE